MIIGITGLGLIGGSLAKAIKKYTEHTVLAADKNKEVLNKALSEQAADGALDEDNALGCDLIILGLYPDGIKEWLKAFDEYIGRVSEGHPEKLSKRPLIIDICGIKSHITEYVKGNYADAAWDYISAHPMAGMEKVGYINSKAELFKGASMLLIPVKNTAAETELLKSLFSELGFGRCIVTDEEKHDRIIAFTSQLAHVVSNAYVKSPSALLHHGYSAGSYRDLTRVAWLNEDMWTELFMCNREYLSEEIGNIINELHKYKDALDEGDPDGLKRLLREGRERKEHIDR